MKHSEVVEKFGKKRSPAALAKKATQKKRTAASRAARIALHEGDPEEAVRVLAEFTLEQRKEAAIRAFANMPTLRSASRAAGVSRRQVEIWIAEDPEFMERMLDAFECANDDLEEMAHLRAKDPENGNDMLKFLLRHNRPDKFRENITLRNDPSSPFSNSSSSPSGPNSFFIMGGQRIPI